MDHQAQIYTLKVYESTGAQLIKEMFVPSLSLYVNKKESFLTYGHVNVRIEKDTTPMTVFLSDSEYEILAKLAANLRNKQPLEQMAQGILNRR